MRRPFVIQPLHFLLPEGTARSYGIAKSTAPREWLRKMVEESPGEKGFVFFSKGAGKIQPDKKLPEATDIRVQVQAVCGRMVGS